MTRIIIIIIILLKSLVTVSTFTENIGVETT